MAGLKLTLVSGAVRYVDSESVVKTPEGDRIAGDLDAGDSIAIFSDGHMPVEIANVEAVE